VLNIYFKAWKTELFNDDRTRREVIPLGIRIPKEKIISNPTKISFCDHSNLLINGNPFEDMLTEDKYHLSS
jgi:hypothetical protein